MESWISGVFSVCMTKLGEFFLSVWLDILTEGWKNGSTNLKITKAHCIYLSGIQKWTPITSTLRQLHDVMQRWWLQSPNLWLNMWRQGSKHVLRICRFILSSQPKQRPCNHQRFKHFTSQKLSLRREGQWDRKSQVRVYACVCVCVCKDQLGENYHLPNLNKSTGRILQAMENHVLLRSCAYESLQESSPLPLIVSRAFFDWGLSLSWVNSQHAFNSKSTFQKIHITCRSCKPLAVELVVEAPISGNKSVHRLLWWVIWA